MTHLLEATTVRGCRVYYVKALDSRERTYFSAYVRLPDSGEGFDQIALDDRVLPRLKERLRQVMSLRTGLY